MFRRKDIQFLELCKAASSIFSTCGKRQYCAILTDDRDRIVGLGYNGGPSGYPHCKDGGCERNKVGSPSGSNYDNCISIHAEQNAFLNMLGVPKRLYVNGPPCFTCAKMIVNTHIEEVIYCRDSSYRQWPEIALFLEENGVELKGFAGASGKS